MIGCPPNEVIPPPVDGLWSTRLLTSLLIIEDWRDKERELMNVCGLDGDSETRRSIVFRSEYDVIETVGLVGVAFTPSLAFELSKSRCPSSEVRAVWSTRSISLGGRICMPKEFAAVARGSTGARIAEKSEGTTGSEILLIAPTEAPRP
jgi:hypothetical protein